MYRATANATVNAVANTHTHTQQPPTILCQKMAQGHEPWGPESRSDVRWQLLHKSEKGKAKKAARDASTHVRADRLGKPKATSKMVPEGKPLHCKGSASWTIMHIKSATPCCSLTLEAANCTATQTPKRRCRLHPNSYCHCRASLACHSCMGRGDMLSAGQECRRVRNSPPRASPLWRDSLRRGRPSSTRLGLRSERG